MIHHQEVLYRVMTVMNLLWSDDSLINLVQKGIEEQHYIKVPDVRFHKKLPDGIAFPDDKCAWHLYRRTGELQGRS